MGTSTSVCPTPQSTPPSIHARRDKSCLYWKEPTILAPQSALQSTAPPNGPHKYAGAHRAPTRCPNKTGSLAAGAHRSTLR